MNKLIASAMLPEALGAGVHLIEDPAKFVKAASVFGGEAMPTPDKDHVGLHLVALGDAEHYGFNRNGDGFPKKACISHHSTFVKNGHVYRHHQNKDPKKSIGGICKSAYNAEMGRIELFIHANKEKCADELEKLAKDGEIPYSMACRVQYDRCNDCGTLRKNASDPKMCDHIRYQLGKTAEDGTFYGTHNDEPKFFDISFVHRPADRIAWHLKTASDGLIDSIKLAEQEGLWVPDHVAIDSPAVSRKLEILRKLASSESELRRLESASWQDKVSSTVWQLRKAATATLTDEQITALRQYEVPDTLHALASNGIVLDPASYCKYAMGCELGTLAPHVEAISKAAADMFTNLQKESRAVDVCNDGLYDIDVTRVDQHPSGLRTLVSAIKPYVSFEEKIAHGRTINSTIAGIEPGLEKTSSEQDRISELGLVTCVVEKYASYKLSTLSAMQHLYSDDENLCQIHLAAAQNMTHAPKV